MKALIIGFGKMGMLHGATLKSLDAIDGIAVCDASGLVREGIRRFGPGIEVFEDYHQAVEAQPFDLAVVATPNDAHVSIVSDLVRRGVHTFVEKPLVTDFEEARALRQTVKKNAGPPVKLMVGYCLRFVPAYLLAKRFLLEGVIGRVEHFQARMFSSDVTSSQGGWRFDKARKGGGVLLDLGSHLVDLVRYLFGTPGELAGTTERRYSRHVEDAFKADLFYRDFAGSVEASWSEPGIRKPTPEITVKADNGTLRVCNDELEVFLKSDRGGQKAGSHRFDPTQLSRPVPFDLAGPFYTEQWLEFISAVKFNRAHRNTIDESLEDHRLIDLIRSSAGVRRVVGDIR